MNTHEKRLGALEARSGRRPVYVFARPGETGAQAIARQLGSAKSAPTSIVVIRWED